MIGNWLGFYQYNRQDIQKIIGFEKTGFTIVIDFFDGEHFKGTVQDDVNTGGMKEMGIIIGSVDNNKVIFKKLMPKRDFIIDDKGSRQITDKKHPTLYYSGTFSMDKNQISGQWKFGYTIGLLWGFIPIPFRPAKGIWNMKLENKN